MSLAMQRNHQLHTTFIRALGDAHDGWIDLIQARPTLALSRLQNSYERVWSSQGRSMPGAKAVIGVPLAEVLYELGELERAHRILGECLAYARENGTVDSLISSYLLLARITLARGDRKTALRYLKELEDVGLDTGLQRVSACAQLELARLLWLQGELNAASRKLDYVQNLSIWSAVSGYALPAHDVESPDLLHWRLLIAQGQPDSAVPELKHALTLALTTQRYRRALKLRIVLAAALMAQGKQKQALQMITQALEVAGKQGFLRMFCDEGQEVEALLLQWFRQHDELNEKAFIDTGYLTRLRAQLGTSKHDKSTDCVRNPTIEHLTKREHEVLLHLAEGGRNRSIAQKLFVSETTIKAHLRSISAKLGAHGRTEAVAIARREGLL